MKKLQVIIQDKTTLMLNEDGHKGDIISLADLEELDTTAITKAIEENTDKVYQKKLAEYKEKLDIEFANEKTKWEADKTISMKEIEEKHFSTIKALESELSNLKATLDSQIKEKEVSFQLEKEKLATQKDKEYQALKMELETLKANMDEKLRSKELEVANAYKDKLNQANSEKTILEKTALQNLESQKARLELEKQQALSKLENQYRETLEEKNQEINNRQSEIDALKRQRSFASVKVIGEELETWCDREVSSYMQNGFDNCTWQKDNKVVKEEDENKGSKADYIFKVYADETKTYELASVCMDMKSEDPASVNKKTNSSYYNQLDKNRNKKECKYALLVSELEMDKVNDIPIFKVKEYPNMYVVRPQYLMTFLNMITSLTTRFKDIVLAKQKEDLAFQEKEVLLEEFEHIKNTYLDKPLETLSKQLEAISKANASILSAHDKIQEAVSSIITSYVDSIKGKIEKFELSLNKQYKKIDKLN